MKTQLFSLSLDEIQGWFVQKNKQKFLARQLLEWIYQKHECDFSKMTNLSLDMRSLLATEFDTNFLELVRVQESIDAETTKFLWKLHDNKLVESVLISSFDRRTVCVSSQVGCPARCAFCASGKKGLVRDLSAAEIVLQVYLINSWLVKKGQRVSHVVYMGMGEPMRNYDNVVRSIQLLNHPLMMNLSKRRITVSTVGVVEGIERFSQEELKVNLVLSLHAPNQKIREKIIPYARQYPLERVMASMWEYAEASRRDVTFEYTLLAGINDAPEHAKELAILLKGKQCTVNLIPYNPVEGLRLNRPDKEGIKEFQRILTAEGIVNTCRYTKGVDISAACGQLALQTEEAKAVNE